MLDFKRFLYYIASNISFNTKFIKRNKSMTIHTGNFIYGLSPIKREDPKDGQSEWYYLAPRNASTFSDFKKIDVPSQNTPNPYAKEIQSYIFKTNPEVYKILYGSAEPEPAQNNQQPQAAQTENSGNIPSFSEQNANNIFPQPQSAVGQAVHNNVTQQPQVNAQNLTETIKSGMPQTAARIPDKNYIERIRELLGDSAKDVQDMYKTQSSLDNAKTFTTDDGGIVYDVQPTFITEGDKSNRKTLTFDDVYFSNNSLKGIDKIEGGYSNRENDDGGATNFGVTQNTLLAYNNWKHPLRKGFNFPVDVKYLTSNQAKQILNEMYYQLYGINKLTNLAIAKNSLDEVINQGTCMGHDLVNVYNTYMGSEYPLTTIISNDFAKVLNELEDTDAVKISDLLSRKRMQRYFDRVDAKPKNINNLRGWFNRLKNYYSNPDEFNNLYNSRVDDYINNKYNQYYNGK